MIDWTPNDDSVGYLQFASQEKCIVQFKHIKYVLPLSQYCSVEAKYNNKCRVNRAGEFTVATKNQWDIFDDDDQYHFCILLRFDKTLEQLKAQIMDPKPRIIRISETDFRERESDFKTQRKVLSVGNLKDQKTESVGNFFNLFFFTWLYAMKKFFRSKSRRKQSRPCFTSKRRT